MLSARVNERSTIVFAFMFGLLLTGVVNAGPITFTTDADFGTGVFSSTNRNAPPGDAVKLNDGIVTPYDFIWMALSGRGTAVRVDTNTGAILGEYYTSPNGMGRNPSRTTVDLNGNVWVGNRNESGSGWGSVTKISATPTRRRAVRIQPASPASVSTTPSVARPDEPDPMTPAGPCWKM